MACALGKSFPEGCLRKTYFREGRTDKIGRIGLAALELLDGWRDAEILKIVS